MEILINMSELTLGIGIGVAILAVIQGVLYIVRDKVDNHKIKKNLELKNRLSILDKEN